MHGGLFLLGFLLVLPDFHPDVIARCMGELGQLAALRRLRAELGSG